MDKNVRNNSMDIFRLICAFMVLAIHVNPFIDISATVYYIVVQILPRIAVPFFFCVSGYWYIQKLEKGQNCFKTTFIKVLRIYLIWTCIYYFRDFFIYIKDGLNIKGIISSFVINFFIYGSSYHFWYFIGLLVTIVVTTILYKANIKTLIWIVPIGFYIIGLLGCSYYSIGNNVGIISALINSGYFEMIRRVFGMAIPFFMLGGIIPYVYEREKRKNVGIKLIISIVLFLTEIILVNALDLQVNIIITIFLPVLLVYTMVFMIKHPLDNMGNIGNKANHLANWTYYVHPMVIWSISWINMNSVCRYIIVGIICIITGILVMQSKKIAKKLMI